MRERCKLERGSLTRVRRPSLDLTHVQLQSGFVELNQALGALGRRKGTHSVRSRPYPLIAQFRELPWRPPALVRSPAADLTLGASARPPHDHKEAIVH